MCGMLAIYNLSVNGGSTTKQFGAARDVATGSQGLPGSLSSTAGRSKIDDRATWETSARRAPPPPPTENVKKIRLAVRDRVS